MQGKKEGSRETRPSRDFIKWLVSCPGNKALQPLLSRFGVSKGTIGRAKFIRETNARGCKEHPSFNQSWKRTFWRRALRFFSSDRIEICANPRDDISSVSRMHFCWRIFWQTSLMFLGYSMHRSIAEKNIGNPYPYHSRFILGKNTGRVRFVHVLKKINKILSGSVNGV